MGVWVKGESNGQNVMRFVLKLLISVIASDFKEDIREDLNLNKHTTVGLYDSCLNFHVQRFYQTKVLRLEIFLKSKM